MNYQETVEYLFQSAPLFQHIGAGAYKEGLETTRALDAHFGHPHRRYATVHVAGTNGKGSCSHTIAAVLQSAGYRVGLFITTTGLLGSLFTSVIGAVLLLWIISFFRHPKRTDI